MIKKPSCLCAFVAIFNRIEVMEYEIAIPVVFKLGQHYNYISTRRSNEYSKHFNHFNQFNFVCNCFYGFRCQPSA
jgi:hypothetical protein